MRVAVGIALLAAVAATASAVDVQAPPADFDSAQGVVRLSIAVREPARATQLNIGPVLVDGAAQTGFRGSGSTLATDAVELLIEPCGPRATALRWRALDGGVHDFVIPLEDNSACYGGGERFSSLNHQGHILPMVSSDHPETKGDTTYKPVPFYLSSRGYAAWVDNPAAGAFDFNATDRYHVRLCYRVSELRLVVIDGPDFATLLDEFTRLTGRPRVPPLWSFAPWKSRDVHRDSADLLADAELTRRHDLPGSVIVIDSPWETAYNDFTLNPQQFAEPEALFARIAALGFYPCFWLTPFINVENVTDMTGIDAGPAGNFAEARQRGLLVRTPGGEPMIAHWWKGRGGLVDLTNPAAVIWWHEQIDRARGWGLRGLKCDDGEGNFVQDAVFFDGTPAALMKNRYAQLYLQAAQAYIDSRLGGDGVLAGRCGFTGAQQQPFGWAGDNFADFSFENGLPTVILAAQNAALSGLPWWGSDIAGYMGKADKELFIRWTQFGAFSPLMLAHMQSNLGPWDYDAETLAIYRTFARLHMSLAPYLLDAAHAANRTGMPIIRPLVLAFPHDERAAAERYQYLFGPDLLVAPMYQRGTARTVYLPRQSATAEGVWLDYWTGAAHTGGTTVQVDAPLARMPLFVRAGAILCLLPDDVDTLIPRTPEMDERVVALDDRRVIAVWPGPAGELLTHEGIRVQTHPSPSAKALAITVTSDTPRRVDVRWMGAPDGQPARVKSIEVGPDPLTLQPSEAEAGA